jgi:tetratricopeptide (TPR) repeat protein/transcriptional regulator with XRE-family HTH domain
VVAEQPGLGFAELLRQLRAEARLTQEELAEAAGLSPRSVSDLERGIHQTARKDTAGLLAGALGLAEPVRTVFVAAARGRAPAAEVLTAMPAEAAPAAPGGAMPPGADEAPPGAVPRQLPAGAAFFAGREAELKQLDALLGRAARGGPAEPGGAVVISAVAGMAGVGKTALAVHWARNVAGRFPDGQLYMNLRGYDAEGAAVTPAEVTGWFLTALGVPASQIPADAPARRGLYRSVLAGRRVLIVLDNARDAAQVRPLLPGGGGCLVVVTSRSALAELAAAEGARPLRLGPLAEEEEVQLLAARLGPERVAAEPGAVAELAAWCGHLPLALAVMAARAAADPGLPLGVLARQLAGAEGAAAPSGAGPGRLEVLETRDPTTGLRQLLSSSYGQLSPPAARMFALLGVHCGPDITVPAAASLAAVPRAAAGRALAELAGASLAAEHRPGRYVLHDLVRGYVAGRAWQVLGEAGIRAAIERSLDHYLHTVIRALPVPPPPFAVAPPTPGVLPEQLAGEAALQDWARAEHQVVLQAIAQAAAAGFLTHAWQIFHGQALLVGGQGYWADIRAAGQGMLAAAEVAGDQVALGWTHAIIGRYGTISGADDAGPAYAAQALDHLRRAGDLSGQAWAHLSAALACFMKGDWAEAVTRAGRALELFRQAGDQAGQGWALAGLGEGHARLGNYDLARGYARQALKVSPAAADPTGLALAWHALGFVHFRLGEPRQAIGCYRQALALVREPKHALVRWLLSSLLVGFGDACRAAGDLSAAVEAWEQAQQILRDQGWPESRRIRIRLEQVGPPSPPG